MQLQPAGEEPGPQPQQQRGLARPGRPDDHLMGPQPLVGDGRDVRGRVPGGADHRARHDGPVPGDQRHRARNKPESNREESGSGMAARGENHKAQARL